MTRLWPLIAIVVLGSGCGAQENRISRPGLNWDYVAPPRGMIGVPYEWMLPVGVAHTPECRAYNLPDGLLIDSASLRIHGVPKRAGEFRSEVWVKDLERDVREQRYLWFYIDTPRDR